jgi:hypothetical protein
MLLSRAEFLSRVETRSGGSRGDCDRAHFVCERLRSSRLNRNKYFFLHRLTFGELLPKSCASRLAA